MITLIIAKKVSVEWRIRHKFIHSLHPPFHQHPTSRCKKTHWVTWRKPQEGYIKINFDGSKSSSHAVGGFILRNWDGTFIQVASCSLGVASILVVEATAMRNGLGAAVHASYTNIHLEGDNQILIQAVQRRIQVPWEIQTLVEDILAYFQIYNHVSVYHIFREGNRATEWLAKYGLNLCSIIVWHQVLHRDLYCILREDYLGRPLERRAT